MDNWNIPVRHITTLKIATRGSCRLGVEHLQVEPGQANSKEEAQQSLQVFDVENRLVAVTDTISSTMTVFFYDASGQRLLTIEPDGTEIYYPFPGYEEEITDTVTIQRSTYFLAGQAVAARISGDPNPDKNGLFFLHSDHLGSNSFMTYGPGHASGTAGALVPGTLARYLPFGDWRAQPFADLTDIGFTGHKGNNLGSNDIGLIYMNARFYVPGVNRFLSADTIVPDPANPQSLNRYTYGYNNPVKYLDPTGHLPCDLVCPGDGFWPGQYNYGGAWNDSWDIEQQQQNSDEAEAHLGEIRNTGVGLLWEPADWTIALSDGFQWYDSLGMLPLIPASWGDNLGRFVTQYGDEAVDALCSFSADTLVLTQDGLKPINEVALYELVWAFNEATGEMGWYPVVAIWVHEDPITVYLTINGEIIETTPEHPFLTADGEWIAAASLQIGDGIRNAAWGIGMVEAVQFTVQPQTMYNFTIATAHTYFVGNRHWLVHNSCYPALEELVHNIHDLLLPDTIAHGQRTTGIIEFVDENGDYYYLVASSEPRLSPRQRQFLQQLGPNFFPVSGPAGKHAEQKILTAWSSDEAMRLSWEPTFVAASRDICGICAELLEEFGIISATP